MDRERFIHEDLLLVADHIVAVIDRRWHEKGAIPTALFWVSEVVDTDDGGRVNHTVVMNLNNQPRSSWQASLKNAVVRTKAYAFLVLEPLPQEVYVLFESVHGTRSWRMPIERHGDVLLLGTAVTRDDVDHYGLLWVPTKMRG